MNIIKNGKLDFNVVKKTTERPKLYEKSTHKFWDDPHIAEQMLAFHLNPDIEAASKTRATIDDEITFIIEETSMDENTRVLDLGCGPGLYVDGFAKTGAHVTGVDLSPNSIAYAKKHIQVGNERVEFKEMNYLDLKEADVYDVITLIFYDFCALSPEDQSTLLAKIQRALKPNGIFIFDVVTEYYKSDVHQEVAFEEGGFWSAEPYWLIKSAYLYDSPKVEGFQYAIIDEEGNTELIRVFHRLFSLAEIKALLEKHNLKVDKFYNNLKGEAFEPHSTTFGIVAKKL